MLRPINTLFQSLTSLTIWPALTNSECTTSWYPKIRSVLSSLLILTNQLLRPGRTARFPRLTVVLFLDYICNTTTHHQFATILEEENEPLWRVVFKSGKCFLPVFSLIEIKLNRRARANNTYYEKKPSNLGDWLER